MAYADYFSTRTTPQSEKIHGSKQVPNNAGGWAFQVDDWQRLDRFLILGSDKGSYYVGPRQLTIENAEAVLRCAKQDGKRTVQRIVEVSHGGLAPKNDPAIFALAICAGQRIPEALEAYPKVCRIPTHAFSFINAVEKFRGHGRALNRALRNWYLDKKPVDVARLVTKYQSRDGWSHRDVLRLTKPKVEGDMCDIFHWVTKGWETVSEGEYAREALLPIWAFERAKRAETPQEVCELILKYGLPRECIPTKFLNEVSVWDALLRGIPMTAMIRNLGKMSAVGLLTNMSEASIAVCNRLASEEFLKKARIHPMALLIAQKVYEQGHGDKGSLTWKPVPAIIDALDAAFYLSFGNVKPSGVRRLEAIDASGSMTASVAGCGSLNCRQAAVALALIAVCTEPNVEVMAFTTSPHAVSLPFSKRQRLTDAMRLLDQNIIAGGTDCAQPFAWAIAHKSKYDAVQLLTDSETWAGAVHPQQALQIYRESYGPCKLAVTSMTANASTVGDPDDPGVLQVVGFDASVPQVVSNWMSGTSQSLNESDD